MARHLAWALLLLSVMHVSSWATPSPPEGTLEMKVKGVVLDPYSQTPMVVLEDTAGQKAFPIWVGLPEAQAIARILERVPTPRPMTHALLRDVLTHLHARVKHVIVHDLRDNTFYANIALHHEAQTFLVDARPSDAITLALVTQAPIFVTKQVLGSVRTVNLAAPPSLTDHVVKKFGMHLQSLNGSLAEAFHLSTTDGVLVAFVEAGGQADRQGFRRGDVITAVSGKHIKALADFLDVVGPKGSDKELLVEVTREQHPVRLRLPFTRRN